ncbi:MAG: two-component system response regulator [Alphaproteobacteria bacterium 64-11]|nr:response regulator [Alphaproteobacteria bacterium]OJU12389.1 MAG: two-component system response regulator [Alphaproteobacteria bacterium 64-11]
MSGTGFEKLSVLVVDDNPHMRSLLRALLNCAGVTQVCEAADGTAAITALADPTIDLVLTDMAMNPMDGVEFTRRVRNERDSPNPFVPVIMITGHAERARVEEARDAGVTEFLAKPLTSQNLYARIAEVVERPRVFVRCDGYFGPDRRRRRADDYAGPWRRKDDFEKVEL